MATVSTPLGDGRKYPVPAMRTFFALLAAFAVVVTACGSGNDDSGTAPTPVLTATVDTEVEPTVPAGEFPDSIDSHVHDCPGPEWVKISHHECMLPADAAEPVPTATPDPSKFPDPVDGHTHECPEGFKQISHDQCVDLAEPTAVLGADPAGEVAPVDPQEGEVAVPRLVGMSVLEAITVLDELGLDWELTFPRPDGNIVTSQTPAPLTNVPEGSVVALTAGILPAGIADGGPNCDVDVTGMEGMVPVDYDVDGLDDTCGASTYTGIKTATFSPLPAGIISEMADTDTYLPSPPSESATAAALRCFDFHRFGERPVDVAKTADGQTVIAQVSWGWHDSIGCYLTLDGTALTTLRAAPVPRNLPSAPTDTSMRCFDFHRFGERPVDVAKTADGQTVIARLSWGWHDSIGCYLVLDDTALAALRSAAARPSLPYPGWYPDPTCRYESRRWDGQAWTEFVDNQGVDSTDPIRQGEADGLAQPGAGFSCAATDPVVAVAGWKSDPTCRYERRWWENRQWTIHVVNSGEEEQQDFLLVGDGYLPLPGPPVDCADRGEPSYAFPCDTPAPSDDPGVGIGGDGLPCATRLPEMGDPLFWNSGWHANPAIWEKAQSDDYWYKHEDISDAEALGYITACLRGGTVRGGGDAYPDSYSSQGPWEGDNYLSVFQECADTWSKSAHAVNFGGMRDSVACVYDTYLDYWVRGTSDQVWYEYVWAATGETIRNWGVGWAEACGSWVDPVPDRSFVEKCVWLRGHYIGHDLARQREAADGKCASVHGFIWSLEQVSHVCAHRYVLVAVVKKWIRQEANRLGLGYPPDEYLPDYRARFPNIGVC